MSRIEKAVPGVRTGRKWFIVKRWCNNSRFDGALLPSDSHELAGYQDKKEFELPRRNVTLTYSVREYNRVQAVEDKPHLS